MFVLGGGGTLPWVARAELKRGEEEAMFIVYRYALRCAHRVPIVMDYAAA